MSEPTIDKDALKGIYINKGFKSEVDKVFPNDTTIYQCTNVNTLLLKNGIKENFNEVFLAREPAIKIGPNENAVHVYRDENGMIVRKRQSRSIIIVCTACVIKEDTDYKIVIASRLDKRHREDEKTILDMRRREDEKTKGGGSSKKAKNIFNYIKKNLNDNVTSAQVLNEKDLDRAFFTIMSDPLRGMSNTEITSAFIEYTVNKEDVDITSLTFNKIINFKVTFCIIYDENRKKIYYSTKFDQDAMYISSDTFNGTYKKIKKDTPLAEPAASEETGAEKKEQDTEPTKSPAEKEKQKENLKERVTAAEKEVQKLKENANANEAVTEAVTKAEKTVKEAKNKIENISEKEETGEFGIGAENVKYEIAVKEAEEAVKEAEKAVNAAAPAAQDAVAAQDAAPPAAEGEAGEPYGANKADYGIDDDDQNTHALDKPTILEWQRQGSRPWSAAPAIPETREAIQPSPPAAASAPNIWHDAMGRIVVPDGANRGVQGGGKRKLTRKQLNIMTLTELKQLHKVNKIKMNNNRTIKALINNYIKNYKKKIISKTKIGR